ncbi:hypothetical protein P7F88_19900 [Vibrio hannami]|uniref:hypothetical protein n=1 Tax=Vibrio hannami TaxID=2717094 RepID=UPI00240FFC42|nr:hypothetical protein [Vibrio hannami]MDG3088211.1 hypothetical protein [Vibrio hannami]
MNRALLKAHLAVLTAVVIWATSFIALKVAIGEVAPMVVVFANGRWFIGFSRDVAMDSSRYKLSDG